MEEKKKSVFDIFDSILPSVTNIYGKIRKGQTGVDPFNKDEKEVSTAQLSKQFNTSSPSITNSGNDKGTSNKTWYIVGGVAVLAIGVGYFYMKKNGLKIKSITS
jgi:hypothetical protein